MIARHIRVTGHVQGVFFRAWTIEQARALGVAGWVRNCSDGSVEAHVEGDKEPVGKLVEMMRRGPEGAQVAQLTAKDVPPEPGEGFAIRR